MQAAQDILSTKTFKISDSDREWLGNGIYFYLKREDAQNWICQRKYKHGAILKATVEVKDNEYLDFDTDEGKIIFTSAANYIINFAKSKGMRLPNDLGDVQERTCTVMRIVWENVKDLKLILASFPSEQREVQFLIDPRKYRKEFCVKDNGFISDIMLIHEEATT